MHAEPGTDLYEVRQYFQEAANSVAALGRLITSPTAGDTSMHPETRAMFAGQVDAVAGALTNMKDFVYHSTTLDKSPIAQADGDSGQGHA